MPWVNLGSEPQVVGQYLGGAPQYSIALPVKGAYLSSAYLGNVTPAQAFEIMETRRTIYEQNQQMSSLKPIRWINVGYVVDAHGMLTAYHQYLLPDWTFNPPVWTNWPNEPAQWGPAP